MVYTEPAPRWQFRVTPAMQHLNRAATTLADIQNTLCKVTVIHSELHYTTRAQWVCSEAENSAIVAISKRLGLI